MDAQLQICTGSDCRKKKKRFKKLYALLGEWGEVGAIKCQDVCKGPVVLVHREEESFWFKKVGNKKARRQILEFLHGEPLANYLSKRLVKRKPHQSKVVRALKAKLS